MVKHIDQAQQEARQSQRLEMAFYDSEQNSKPHHHGGGRVSGQHSQTAANSTDSGNTAIHQQLQTTVDNLRRDSLIGGQSAGDPHAARLNADSLIQKLRGGGVILADAHLASFESNIALLKSIGSKPKSADGLGVFGAS